MHEPNGWANPADEGLVSEALLYAGGEMTADEAGAFQQRLAGDQAAREALATAVGLLAMLADGRSVHPDPAYRNRVIARLCPTRGVWSRLARPRLYRGHPAAWALTGAAAAVLLMLVWVQAPGTPTSLGSREPAARLPVESPRPAAPAAGSDVATVWATLHSPDHLLKAHDEAARRKTRAEDRLQAARPDVLQHHAAPQPDRNN